MAGETKQSIDNEAQIRELIDTLLAAVSAKDIEASLAMYSPDIVSYDVIGPLQNNGATTIRKRLNEWFSSFNGHIEFEFRDPQITVGENVAFCNGLHHVKGKMTDGKELEMWWRTTLCLCKVDGKWTIKHSHDSVPFDPATGAASLALKP